MGKKFYFIDFCEDMRLKSGEVDTEDPVVALLYLLARDHLTPSQITTAVDSIVKREGDQRVFAFTNGFLANHIKYELDRIRTEITDTDIP